MSKRQDTISDSEAAASLMKAIAPKEHRRTVDRPSKRSRTTPSSNNQAHDTSQSYYYGPNDGSKSLDNPSSAGTEKKQKANFGLSGALAKDASGGGSHIYKGVKLKFQEPPEARTPNTLWRFYVFKGDDQIDTLHVARQSAYLFGRNEEIADVHLAHPSCSSQHAVLQYRATPNAEGKLACQPYLLDLESTNGSFLNGVQIDAARYYQLKKGDVLRFGSSTREYVLLTAEAKSKKV